MAKAFAAPKGFEWENEYGIPFDQLLKKEQAHEEKLRAWVKQHSPTPKSKIVGKILRFSVADGYAIYMVFSTKPFHLIHIKYGDGYSADPALIRGLTVADATQRIKFDDELKAMFKKNEPS